MVNYKIINETLFGGDVNGLILIYGFEDDILLDDEWCTKFYVKTGGNYENR